MIEYETNIEHYLKSKKLKTNVENQVVKVCKKLIPANFIILFGGPGPYDPEDKEDHDTTWAKRMWSLSNLEDQKTILIISY